MKIRLIDFGVSKDHHPYRSHGNDAGADVYMPYDCTLQPGEIAKVPLGFGIEVPDGYAGYIFPRTSMAIKGLVCDNRSNLSLFRKLYKLHKGWSCKTDTRITVINKEFRVLETVFFCVFADN